MPSAERSAGGSFDSSTPGPPIGDPDSATKRRDPSRESFTPRGRLPTGTWASTAPVDPSRMTTVPAISLETYRTAPSAGSFEAGEPTCGLDHRVTASAKARGADLLVQPERIQRVSRGYEQILSAIEEVRRRRIRD